jgi:hypothetical protein
VLTVLLAFTACDSKTDEQRCSELDEYLTGRAIDLPRDCTVDLQCHVVTVRPGDPIAAATIQPTDDALLRAIRSYESSCGSLPRAQGSLEAVCEQRTIEILDSAADGGRREQVLDQVCVLRGDFTLEDVGITDAGDAGEDIDAVEDVCECEDNSDCPDGRCVACSCVPTGVCGDACGAAAACDLTEQLNLGLSPSDCAARCDGALEASADFSDFVGCLSTSSCDVMLTCNALLP